MIPLGVPDEWIVHVFPIEDMKEHETRGRGECWCGPEVHMEGMGYVVVHREFLEVKRPLTEGI